MIGQTLLPLAASFGIQRALHVLHPLKKPPVVLYIYIYIYMCVCVCVCVCVQFLKFSEVRTLTPTVRLSYQQ